MFCKVYKILMLFVMLAYYDVNLYVTLSMKLEYIILEVPIQTFRFSFVT